ncbi:MAG: isoprenylcysteine carboxylmethyltransferase family protein [Acidobacteria bacterium]|nr:MAG: isoprenylcysteine carboxylmethyltransferase family protein [Acidobacteriota bacterium]
MAGRTLLEKIGGQEGEAIDDIRRSLFAGSFERRRVGTGVTMNFYTSPFFWAFISMIGMHGATLAVGGHRIARRLPFVSAVLALVTAGRIMLPLPICPQPRFDLGSWQSVAGGLILLIALGVAAPALTVKWWRPPEPGMKLRTTGIYALVRHPIYLSEVLWPAGWSLIWGSVYGLALTPIWWLAFLLHAIAEEDRLEAVLGSEYAEYKARVRGRLFPGLPF